MILLAVLSGSLAVYLSNVWLDRQQQAQGPVVQRNEPVNRGRLVVAARPLRFGTPLTPDSVKEIDWPADSLPDGAFGSAASLTSGPQPRVALAAMEPNEPVLASKITGPGQRATLSAVMSPGARAVTVRVNDVAGVAGFVLPGDHVDLLLTRTEEQASFTDLVLQDIKVLAIDQVADDKTDQPSVAKAVTVEVDPEQGQKIALASTIGTLSLSLRAAGGSEPVPARRVREADLLPVSFRNAQTDAAATEWSDQPPPPSAPVSPTPPATEVTMKPGAADEIQPFVSVIVTRAVKRQDYSVPKLLR